MIKIRVPATSANLGSGFDTAGIALNMYNEVYVETGNGFAVHTLDNTEVPRDRSNLIYTSFCKLYERRAETPPEIELWQRNDIPMERGLGSSAACIVAGLLAANELMGKPYSRHELLDLAARIEGHPDNVAPAFFGRHDGGGYRGRQAVFRAVRHKKRRLLCGVHTAVPASDQLCARVYA